MKHISTYLSFKLSLIFLVLFGFGLAACDQFNGNINDNKINPKKLETDQLDYSWIGEAHNDAVAYAYEQTSEEDFQTEDRRNERLAFFVNEYIQSKNLQDVMMPDVSLEGETFLQEIGNISNSDLELDEFAQELEKIEQKAQETLSFEDFQAILQATSLTAYSRSLWTVVEFAGENGWTEEEWIQAEEYITNGGLEADLPFLLSSTITPKGKKAPSLKFFGGLFRAIGSVFSFIGSAIVRAAQFVISGIRTLFNAAKHVFMATIKFIGRFAEKVFNFVTNKLLPCLGDLAKNVFKDIDWKKVAEADAKAWMNSKASKVEDRIAEAGIASAIRAGGQILSALGKNAGKFWKCITG